MCSSLICGHRSRARAVFDAAPVLEEVVRRVQVAGLGAHLDVQHVVAVPADRDRWREPGHRDAGVDGGVVVDRLALDQLCAPAVVVDARGKAAREAITWADLERHAGDLRPGVILVLHTGWSRYWGSDTYADHPFLDGAAARQVVERGVRTVAIDAMSVDETVDTHEHPSGFAAHFAVLGAGGAIAENLRNLEAVDFPDPVVSILPIRFRGADGAPVRAVALELGP